MEIYEILQKCVDQERYPGDPYYLSLDADCEDEICIFLFDLFIRTGALDYELQGITLDERKEEAINQVKLFFASEKYEIVKGVIKCLLEHSNNKEHVLSIIVEDDYAELVYRDSYYMYYATKHYSHSRMCSRLFFFKGYVDGVTHDKSSVECMNKSFLGFMTLKPSNNGIISRTILKPKYIVEQHSNASHFIRTCKYDCTMYGARLMVEGFPYMMQDTETTTCAEVTILNLADYYSKKYVEYHLVMPSEIDRLVSKYTPEGTLPTHGMSYANLTHVLKDIGFQPRLYASPSIDLKRIINYYVDSAIPLALGLFPINARKGKHGHSVVCVGKRIKECVYNDCVQELLFRDDVGKLFNVFVSDEADASSEYFIMDDNKMPYTEMRVEERCSIVHMTQKVEMIAKSYSHGIDWVISSVAVPLGKGMHLDAMAANAIVRRILASTLGLNYAYEHLEDESIKAQWSKYLVSTSGLVYGTARKNPLIFRLFLSTSRSFKRHRVSTLSATAALIYEELPMPQYVWICEIYTPRSYGQKQVIGEVVLDATASQYELFKSIVLIQYPHTIHYRFPQTKYSDNYWKNKMQEPYIIDEWEPFRRFEFGKGGN